MNLLLNKSLKYSTIVYYYIEKQMAYSSKTLKKYINSMLQSP